MSHFIPSEARPFGRNQYRALCGSATTGQDFSATPSCPACAAKLAEDDAAIVALSQAPQASFGGPPVKHQPFDPCAGYVRHGERRHR